MKKVFLLMSMLSIPYCYANDGHYFKILINNYSSQKVTLSGNGASYYYTHDFEKGRTVNVPVGGSVVVNSDMKYDGFSSSNHGGLGIKVTYEKESVPVIIEMQMSSTAHIGGNNSDAQLRLVNVSSAFHPMADSPLPICRDKDGIEKKATNWDNRSNNLRFVTDHPNRVSLLIDNGKVGTSCYEQVNARATGYDYNIYVYMNIY